MTLIDTKFALLQALISGESYGLELIERVRTHTHGEVRLLQGRVYPVLRQLETQGLIESYEAAHKQPRLQGSLCRRSQHDIFSV